MGPIGISMFGPGIASPPFEVRLRTRCDSMDEYAVRVPFPDGVSSEAFDVAETLECGAATGWSTR